MSHEVATSGFSIEVGGVKNVGFLDRNIDENVSKNPLE